MTDAAGARAERTIYRPYGNWSSDLTAQFDPTTPAESHGYIGERLDADAGLLFLNARYMDPQLGMFIQPDWWEVTEHGVGTNRYAYAFGDPVNGSDPGGNTYCAADGICFDDGGPSIPGFDFDPVGRDLPKTVAMASAFAAVAVAPAAISWATGYEGTMALTALANEGLASVSGGLAITGAAVGGGKILSSAGPRLEGVVDDLVKAPLAAASDEAIDFVRGVDSAKYVGTKAKRYTVYEGIDAKGAVKYCGITCRSVEMRSAEHLASGTARADLFFQAVPGATGLTRMQARIWEQRLISRYLIGNLYNKINSIAPKYWLQNGIQ